MDRGTWWATFLGVTESDTPERLTLKAYQTFTWTRLECFIWMGSWRVNIQCLCSMGESNLGSHRGMREGLTYYFSGGTITLSLAPLLRNV